MPWGTCVTGGIITFPWTAELLCEADGLIADWDCMGCELIEGVTVVFESPLTGDDHRVKSGKGDGDWTFDNMFPGSGFMRIGVCLDNVGVKLPLVDSKRTWIYIVLIYFLFLPVFFIISKDDSPFESSCNIFYLSLKHNKLLMFIK